MAMGNMDVTKTCSRNYSGAGIVWMEEKGMCFRIWMLMRRLMVFHVQVGVAAKCRNICIERYAKEEVFSIVGTILQLLSQKLSVVLKRE